MTWRAAGGEDRADVAIEIDGESHNKKIEYDNHRQKRLESLGIRFLRFYDIDVKKNMNGVLSTIENWLLKT